MGTFAWDEFDTSLSQRREAKIGNFQTSVVNETIRWFESMWAIETCGTKISARKNYGDRRIREKTVS
jgi:hypothetical protein